MGFRTQTKKGFTYAKGKLPILLVAHMDTVHKTPVKTICYSRDGKIMMSPEGIGGDDRAGVYMILEILKKHRCHVLFCEDEETGGIGAREFTKSKIMPEVNYIIELDRRGHNDAVFYECDNPEFTAFVTDFGFHEETGSFSDISIIAPALGIAAVNISAGYYNEHSRHEYVDMEAVAENIERVGKMVKTTTGKFEYIESIRHWGGRFDKGYYEDYGMGFYFRNYMESKSVMMNVLNDRCHVKNLKGELEECDGQYCIDREGNLYEYLFDLDVAVLVEGEARTENNMPVKFRSKEAVEIEVVPKEYALVERAWMEGCEDEKD